MMAVGYSVNRTVCFGYKLLSPSLVLYTCEHPFRFKAVGQILLLCYYYDVPLRHFIKLGTPPYNPSMRKVLLPPFHREEIKGQRGK